jgi:hypothetical protein
MFFFIDDDIKEHIHNINYLKENAVEFKKYNAFFLDWNNTVDEKTATLVEEFKNANGRIFEIHPWTCDNCTYKENTGNNCKICENKKAPSKWEEAPTLEPSRKTSESVGAPTLELSKVSAPERKKSAEDHPKSKTWTCEACTLTNSNDRDRCILCRTKRTDGGKIKKKRSSKKSSKKRSSKKSKKKRKTKRKSKRKHSRK